MADSADGRLEAYELNARDRAARYHGPSSPEPPLDCEQCGGPAILHRCGAICTACGYAPGCEV